MSSPSMALRGILMGILVAAILLLSSSELVSASPDTKLGRKFLAVYSLDYNNGGGGGSGFTPPADASP